MKVNPVVRIAALAVLLASTGLAQILSVVSGDAQITAQNNSTVYPLVVIVKDSAGRPMQGVTVTWFITGPGHLVPGNSSVTDVNGLTSVHFVGDFQFDGPGFRQSTVVASAGNSSVSMFVTTSGMNLSSGTLLVRADVLTPVLGDTLSTPGAGESARFVEVSVTANGNQGSLPVQNVGIRLIPDHPEGPSLACAEGTGLTGTNGIAHCVVVFSGTNGSDRFTIEVGGGFRTFGPFNFVVTQAQAQPSVVRITGGNNQAALPGAPLPAPLTARVEDAAGHPMPGVGVTWQVIVPQTVTLSSISSTSDSNGIVSALATLGSTVGLAQVRVRASTGGEAIFNLTVRQPASTGAQSSATRIRILTGNNQSGTVGTRFTDTLTARVEDSAGNPLPNVAVVWRASPSISLSSTVSTTNSSGVVSTVATATSASQPLQVDVETQGGAPTPFGVALVTISATFNMTVGTGSTPPTVGTGSPAALRILTGNNQSGPVGSPLPVRLTARVEDANGNLLPNIPVTWAPSASVMLTSTVSVSDSTGTVSTIATPTSSTAPIKVDLQTQGVTQTPFGPAAGATITASFSISIGAAPVTPASVSSGYIAHIADGAEWKTTITVVNLLSVVQRITLSFWTNSGQKWALPIAGGSVVEQKVFDLQPNASGFLETSGSAAVVSTGWATVDGSVSGSSGVGASAIFRSHAVGQRDSEAVSAMGVATTKGLIIPFDNRNGFATGIAIGNAGTTGVIPITIRDDVGNILLNENLPLGTNGHISFSLGDRYAQTTGRAGTIEIGSSSAAALGLRFNPAGSFTSVPPIAKP